MHRSAVASFIGGRAWMEEDGRGGRKRQVRRNRGDHQHHSPGFMEMQGLRAMRAKLQWPLQFCKKLNWIASI
jgi:hypothetical protein